MRSAIQPVRSGFIRCSGFIGPVRVPPAGGQRVELRDLRRERAGAVMVGAFPEGWRGGLRPRRAVCICPAPPPGATPGARFSARPQDRTPPMARIVMKFGGTSVADLDRIRNVALRVKREVDAGHQVAVVVSAMSGVTNQLVKWCQDLSPLHDAREYDTVVATGEQVTTA
jgi:hypothetical protein